MLLAIIAVAWIETVVALIIAQRSRLLDYGGFATVMAVAAVCAALAP